MQEINIKFSSRFRGGCQEMITLNFSLFIGFNHAVKSSAKIFKRRNRKYWDHTPKPENIRHLNPYCLDLFLFVSGTSTECEPIEHWTVRTECRHHRRFDRHIWNTVPMKPLPEGSKVADSISPSLTTKCSVAWYCLFQVPTQVLISDTAVKASFFLRVCMVFWRRFK